MTRWPATLLLVVATLIPRSAPVAADDDCRVVDDFLKAKVGELPPDWKLRDESGKGVYSVQDEGGRRLLHAASKGIGIQLAKQFEWDVKAYPILAWSWRPLEFPRGADERDSKTNDSAVAVYMLGPYSRIRGFKAVKYIWSERVPAGTHLTSSAGMTQVLVLRTGTEKKGAWVDEKVNVRDDYVKFFGEKDMPKVSGIAVLTDSDDTKSSAQGDYANFRVCRN